MFAFLVFVFCSLQMFVCGHLLRARGQLGLSLSVDSDPAAAISEARQEIYIKCHCSPEYHLLSLASEMASFSVPSGLYFGMSHI